MPITPQTNIRLLKTPFELDNKNQLTFTDVNAQTTYFLGLSHIEEDNCTYQRKDNVIRFPAHIDTIIGYNYCMYQNENYSNKWFYAFITNMRYLNDNVTEISITTDVFQTWQFDFTFKASFVEREMIAVANDTPGANLLPEGLETGEFIINNTIGSADFDPVYVVAYADNVFEYGGTTYNFDGTELNGIPQAVMFILTNNLNTLLTQINADGKGDKVVTAFCIPKFCINTIVSSLVGDYVVPLTNNTYFEPIKDIIVGTKPTTLNGYTPRNKKLLTWPYCYLGFSIPGSQKIYRYEDFNIQNTDNIKFSAISEVNPNPTCYLMPQNYKGISNSTTFKINVPDACVITGYPTLSTKNDYFNTWLAQNSNIVQLSMKQEQFNYEIEAIKTGASFAGALLGGFTNPNANLLTEGVNAGLNAKSLDVNHDYYIKNQMAQIEKQSMLPDQVNIGNSNATLFGYSSFNQQMFLKYSIKQQFAERIDKFFDMYGYLTNTVKVPNLKNRPNWNYVKTIGANIIGDIPQMDLQAIKDIFNNGVTLWHTSTYFLDYTQNNR